jgi:hypothetical protein
MLQILIVQLINQSIVVALSLLIIIYSNRVKKKRELQDFEFIPFE